MEWLTIITMLRKARLSTGNAEMPTRDLHIQNCQFEVHHFWINHDQPSPSIDRYPYPTIP